MPELPEVETIARSLDKSVAGDVIESVWLGSKPEPLKSSAEEIVATLESRRIATVRRVGKHIVYDLEINGVPGGRRAKKKMTADGGVRTTQPGGQWIVHLGMTGRVLVCKPGDEVGAQSSNLPPSTRTRARCKGWALAFQGIIDIKTGMLRESPNLPGWASTNVREEIEERLGTRVILENDANAAALGEKWLGAARDVEDMAMLTLGTGVGGGIVLGSRIFHGMTGMAGEFGHITVEPEGVPCPCGNRGCLEQYASATAVVRMAREAIKDGRGGALTRAASSDPEFSAKAVYNLAIQGDEEAKKIFGRVGRALGIGIADLVNALNLPMYVVGGGVSSAWEAFSPFIFEELRQRSMVYAATAPASLTDGQGASAQVEPGGPTKTVITRALLGSDAGLYGAARLPMIGNL